MDRRKLLAEVEISQTEALLNKFFRICAISSEIKRSKTAVRNNLCQEK